MFFPKTQIRNLSHAVCGKCRPRSVKLFFSQELKVVPKFLTVTLIQDEMTINWLTTLRSIYCASNFQLHFFRQNITFLSNDVSCLRSPLNITSKLLFVVTFCTSLWIFVHALSCKIGIFLKGVRAVVCCVVIKPAPPRSSLTLLCPDQV